MPAGIVTALGARGFAKTAVLEVDEGYVPQLIDELHPSVIVLLNLSRDQLDRVGEVRMIANRWRQALNDTAAIVVANADDPLVAYAASSAARVFWVGMGSSWHRDAYHCPNCDGRIEYDETGWSCACGFGRPRRIAEVQGEELVLEDGTRLAIETELPGDFNRANLAIAAIAARCLGVDPTSSLRAMSTVKDVAGRFSTFNLDGRNVQLLLAKNPAGWTSLIDLARGAHLELVIAINSRIADGHDPSWLFDVPFERLRGHTVIASGDRRFDLAVRLRHAEVTHRVGDASALRALRELTSGDVEVIANYTAFQDLRHDLMRSRPSATVDSRTLDATRAFVSAPVRPSSVSRLRVVVIYPDLLGTYGDTGNGTVLANRALWRGHDAEVILAESDHELPLDGDIYLIGGGEDGPQIRAAQQLRAAGFATVIERGAVVFGVCAGYQIMGSSFPGADGETHEGLGLLDVITARSSSPRAVGELLGEATLPEWSARLGVLTGFENHASHTQLGATVTPFMQVRVGVGNGNAGFDGAIQGRVLGTYLHGPALARNPALADLLLELATGVVFEPLDDHEEQSLRDERLGALGIRR
jgi:CobQ-like glutamine amidotransferase family enzyme